MKRIALLLLIGVILCPLAVAQNSGANDKWYTNLAGWDSNYVGPEKYRAVILYVYNDSGASAIWVANKNDTASTKRFTLNPGEKEIFFKNGPWIRFKAAKSADSCRVRWHWDR
jgi:hypothetical protein